MASSTELGTVLAKLIGLRRAARDCRLGKRHVLSDVIVDATGCASFEIDVAIAVGAVGLLAAKSAVATVAMAVEVAIAGSGGIAAATEERTQSRDAGGCDANTEFESRADCDPGRGPQEVLRIEERVDKRNADNGSSVATVTELALDQICEEEELTSQQGPRSMLPSPWSSSSFEYPKQ